MKTTWRGVVGGICCGGALLAATVAEACTGVTLHAENGDIAYGRTLEWGAFDLKSRIFIYPANYHYSAKMPPGMTGLSWVGKYGIAGIDVLEKGYLADAMNQAGLAAGLFYHPGFAEYAEATPENAARGLAPTDVMQYLLSTCASVAEARQALEQITVVAVVEEALGFPAPIHLMLTDDEGAQIVVEWQEGKVRIYEAPLGVITNAPYYDWHLTNLRNYGELHSRAWPAREVKGVDLSPLGGGSGMLGMPGDFTPPSRFIRAAAFAQSARPLPDGEEAIYELFRILDNFNVPLGNSEGGDQEATAGMRSATIWTTAQDLARKKLYYHTQDNRQVQLIDVNRIAFDRITEPIILPLDEQKQQSVRDRTPTGNH